MKRVTVTIVLLIVAISLATYLTLTQNTKQPDNKTTYVWFEDLSHIDDERVNSGIALADGTYSATLKDGSQMLVTVDNGIWYFGE